MFNQWQIWFFIDARSRNVIHDWLIAEKVPKEQIAAFQAKIDDFEIGGPDLVPGFISETPIAPKIYKMKIKGNIRMEAATSHVLPWAIHGPRVYDFAWCN